MERIVCTIHRIAHIVVASIAVELALEFGAGALAVIPAPTAGPASGVRVEAGPVPVRRLSGAEVDEASRGDAADELFA